MKDAPELVAGHHRFRRKVAGQELVRATLARSQSPRGRCGSAAPTRGSSPRRSSTPARAISSSSRNIGNVVSPFGTNETVGASIEFAVLRLHVTHIIVCGHTGCGAVAALGEDLDPVAEPNFTRWVERLRPAADAVAAMGLAPAERELATVQANVLLQLDNLFTYPCVEAAVAAGSLSVSAAVYALATGEIQVFDDDSAAWIALSSAP